MLDGVVMGGGEVAEMRAFGGAGAEWLLRCCEREVDSPGG